MKTLLLFVFSVTLCTWVPIVEAAGSGESVRWGWIAEGVGRFVNLFILFGVIYYFAREPVHKFFVERRLDIQQEISSTRQSQEEAAAKLSSMERRVKDLDRELAALHEEAETEAEGERRRLREQAQQDAETIVGAARREIDRSTRAAQKQLKEYAAKLSVELAEERIRREMSEQDEGRVVESFLVELGPAGRKERD